MKLVILSLALIAAVIGTTFFLSAKPACAGWRCGGTVSCVSSAVCISGCRCIAGTCQSLTAAPE